MAFRDHPVFADDAGDDDGPGAVIIDFAERVVRHRAHPGTATGALPVAEISLQRTAKRLTKLDPSVWSVVQDPTLGCDHLVVGRGETHAVTTIRLVGKVLVAGEVMLHNGHCTDTIARLRADAEQIAVRLGVQVRALLVVDSEELAVREEPDDVGVTSSHRLRTWLERRPALPR